MRDLLNEFLSDWGMPVILVIMLLGAATGVAMNWRKINSTNTEEKNEGLIGVLYIVLYVFLAIAILGGIVVLVSSMDLSI